MHIIAVDPGPVESAYVVLNSKLSPGELMEFGKYRNTICRERLEYWLEPDITYFGIEMPACYGMAVGRDVFDTCAMVGHFEALAFQQGISPTRIYRKHRSPEGIESVVMAICKDSRAKDSNVRQALIDMYPATGGGSIPQIGTKKQPGPLYGVTKDVWAALAVGITFQMWLKENA